MMKYFNIVLISLVFLASYKVANGEEIVIDEKLPTGIAKDALVTISAVRKRLHLRENSRLWARTYHEMITEEVTSDGRRKNIENHRRLIDGAGDEITKSYEDYFECINSDVCAESVFGRNQFVKLQYTMNIEDEGEYLLKRVSETSINPLCEETIDLNYVCDGSEYQDRCFDFTSTFKYDGKRIKKLSLLVPYFISKRYSAKRHNQHLLCNDNASGDGSYLIKVYKKTKSENGEEKLEEIKKFEKKMIVNHQLRYWGKNGRDYSKMLVAGKLSGEINSMYLFFDPFNVVKDNNMDGVITSSNLLFNQYSIAYSNENEKRLIANIQAKRKFATNKFMSLVERTCRVSALYRPDVAWIMTFVSNSFIDQMIDDPCDRGLEIYTKTLNIKESGDFKSFYKHLELYNKHYKLSEHFTELIDWMGIITEASKEELDIIFSDKNLEITKELDVIEQYAGYMMGLIDIYKDDSNFKSIANKFRKLNVKGEKSKYSTKFYRSETDSEGAFLYEFSAKERVALKESLLGLYFNYAKRFKLVADSKHNDIDTIIEVVENSIFRTHNTNVRYNNYLDILKRAIFNLIKNSYDRSILSGVEDLISKYEVKPNTTNLSLQELREKIIEVRSDMLKCVKYFFKELSGTAYTRIAFEIVDKDAKAFQVSEAIFLKDVNELLNSKIIKDEILKSDDFLDMDVDWE